MRRKITIAALIVLILGALVAFDLLNPGRLVKSNNDYILTQAEWKAIRRQLLEDPPSCFMDNLSIMYSPSLAAGLTS